MPIFFSCRTTKKGATTKKNSFICFFPNIFKCIFFIEDPNNLDFDNEVIYYPGNSKAPLGKEESTCLREAATIKRQRLCLFT